VKQDADRDSTEGASRSPHSEQPGPQDAATTAVGNDTDELVAALDRLAATVELATHPGISAATVRCLLRDDIGKDLTLLRHLLAADDGQNRRPPPPTAADGDRSFSG
jgi:hypothetical protein